MAFFLPVLLMRRLKFVISWIVWVNLLLELRNFDGLLISNLIVFGSVQLYPIHLWVFGPRVFFFNNVKLNHRLRLSSLSHFLDPFLRFRLRFELLTLSVLLFGLLKRRFLNIRVVQLELFALLSVFTSVLDFIHNSWLSHCPSPLDFALLNFLVREGLSRPHFWI